MKTREQQIREAAFIASFEDKPIYKREVVANGIFMATEEVKLRDCDRPIARHFFKRGAQWADANQPSPWISVEERLPEEDTAILEAYTLTVEYQGVKEEKECILKSMYNKGFVCNGEKRNIMGGTTCNTTHHWMPIPELPK